MSLIARFPRIRSSHRCIPLKSECAAANRAPRKIVGRLTHTPPLFFSLANRRGFFQTYVVDNFIDFFKDSTKFVKGCRTPGDQRAWRATRARLIVPLPQGPTPPPAQLTHSQHARNAPFLRTPFAAFVTTLVLTAGGALMMGVISFVVKVVHIPLTQLLVLKTE